jgi:hypothetical protein
VSRAPLRLDWRCPPSVAVCRWSVQRLRGPILDRPRGRVIGRLGARQNRELLQPVVFLVAHSRMHPAVPQTVQVRTTIEAPHLGIVPISVVVVADMTWLMHILDEMDQEPQGEPPILDRLALVLQRRPEPVDLVDHAAVLRFVC